MKKPDIHLNPPDSKVGAIEHSLFDLWSSDGFATDVARRLRAPRRSRKAVAVRGVLFARNQGDIDSEVEPQAPDTPEAASPLL